MATHNWLSLKTIFLRYCIIYNILYNILYKPRLLHCRRPWHLIAITGTRAPPMTYHAYVAILMPDHAREQSADVLQNISRKGGVEEGRIFYSVMHKKHPIITRGTIVHEPETGKVDKDLPPLHTTTMLQHLAHVQYLHNRCKVIKSRKSTQLDECTLWARDISGSEGHMTRSGVMRMRLMRLSKNLYHFLVPFSFHSGWYLDTIKHE